VLRLARDRTVAVHATNEMAATTIAAAVQMVFRPHVDQNVAMITQTIQRSAESGGADIILFPECAVTGYNRDFTAIRRSDIEVALARIAEAARRSRCNVLVGSPTFVGRRRIAVASLMPHA